MTPPSAVVFDFDGVLANSEPIHLAAYQTVLADRGLVLPERDYYQRFLGFNDEDAFRAIGAAYGQPFTERDVAMLTARKTALIPTLLAVPGVIFPGARDCVASLAAHVPLAIASGAKRHEIEPVLAANGLDRYFQVLVTSGDTLRSKPAPDPYAKAIALLQERGLVPPGDAGARRSIAIEDSLWGIVSARAAGLRAVGITTSYPATELQGADLLIDDLAELTLERLADIVEDR